ncbi:hypothetical protein HPB51_025250 [Rhipicephalus microplus]|uniref:Uncharacterized protein n=1 Tax=Rhipicephalus microplus TaxID=6941 RepID=A0A9J6EKE6_RHIMP|nr:hypothetical protein HPB51_025250 [Rhipicephalus microplus]
MQLLERDTELAKMRCSHEEELQRQCAFQESQLDELQMQAADLHAQITEAQQDCHRDASQAQAQIVELNKKEAKYNKNQERIKELEVRERTFSAKGSKLETQLNLVSHSETALKHSLRRCEDELETMKEKLAKLKQVLNSALMENKWLMEQL